MSKQAASPVPTSEQVIGEWRMNRDRAAELVREVEKRYAHYMSDIFESVLDAKSFADIIRLCAAHPEADTWFVMSLRLGMATAMIHAKLGDSLSEK